MGRIFLKGSYPNIKYTYQEHRQIKDYNSLIHPILKHQLKINKVCNNFIDFRAEMHITYHPHSNYHQHGQNNHKLPDYARGFYNNRFFNRLLFSEVPKECKDNFICKYNLK